jgi:hypothetical protein
VRWSKRGRSVNENIKVKNLSVSGFEGV